MLAVGAGLLVVVLIVVLVLMRKGGGEEADADVTPTAVITVSPARSGAVEQLVQVYGVVAADPAASINVAAPKQAIVARVLVRTGETVRAGQPLVEVANAPGSELAFRQAADAATFARNDLARVQRLYEEKLAANDQLEAAKKALADAEAGLTAQQKQGASKPLQVLSAPQAGVVTAVSASPGDHVAQDAPLVALARAGAEVAKLGLEPGVAAIAPGQSVTIRPVAGGAPIVSRISMVGRAADQSTKTLDALAPLNGAGLPVGAAVRAEVATGQHQGLIVPRTAVVFDETGAHLFTVSGGKAHRVFVQTGSDHGDDLEVKGQIAPGALIAVEGAYELQDGMAVKVRP
jgi:RND family efflux transporter MFP subunit